MSSSAPAAGSLGSANPPSRSSPSQRKFLSLLTITIYGCVFWAVEQVFSTYLGHDSYLYWFAYLAAWRYTRFFVSLVSWFAYRPALVLANPRYTPNKDVTVILPTIDPTGVDFQECISTCAANSPAAIFVITAGDELLRKTKAAVQPYMEQFPLVEFTISRTNVASKREQVALAIPMVKTAITVMLDDHVFWKPNFLAGLLAPFEDYMVGMVGTNKAVRRGDNLSPWRRIWNMIGAVYLLRHNFEIRATNAVDGGVFVVSGRTCAIRTAIIQDPVYMAGYTNELFFFKSFGPLNADDDNYTTRFCVTRGWRIKIQYTPETEITTTVGVADPVATKFLGQCRRWVRTTWRSNSCSLFTDGSVWSQQPWCVYAVYFTSFTNFALFTDAALVYLIRQSSAAQWWWLVVLWIVFTKAVKVSAYFWQHPQDLWTFPCYLLFAYFHSLIKLWALLTFWDCTWSGRDFTKIDAQARASSDDSTTAPASDDTPAPPADKPASAAQTLADLNKELANMQSLQTDYMACYQNPLEATLVSMRGPLDAILANHTLIVERDVILHREIKRMTDLVDKLGNTQAGQASPALRELHTRLAKLPLSLRGRMPIPMPGGGPPRDA